MENNLKNQHYKNMSIKPQMEILTFEAESVAFAVCEYLGIDSSDYSFGYVSSWSQGKELEELKACLSTIHGTSVEMIKNIEKNLILMDETAACMQPELDMKKKTIMKL